MPIANRAVVCCLRITFVAIVATVILFGARSGNANEVVMVKAEVKPEKIKAPCPVTLQFRALIMTDDFGDIQYRWTRSDEETMPVEILTLPEKKRKRSGYVTMTWSVSPMNTPGGREYAANVQIVSPDSLGSMADAKAWVECEGASQTSGNDENQQPQNAGDDLFVLGSGNEDDTLVIGQTDGTVTPEQKPRPAVRPVEFACPVREISVRVVEPLPPGWQPIGNRATASATFKAKTVSKTPSGTRLICLYQNGSWLLPLSRPMPDGYLSCDVKGDYFHCTG